MNDKKQIVRTPDSAFKNLKDYPFTPNYMELTGRIRMHYIEEGKDNKKTIFLFHGQPSWSYLYRHMIPPLVNDGYHVIAPDLIGFGKSDKPTHAKDHTFSNHVTWMSEFVNRLGITNATAFYARLGWDDWFTCVGK